MSALHSILSFTAFLGNTFIILCTIAILAAAAFLPESSVPIGKNALGFNEYLAVHDYRAILFCIALLLFWLVGAIYESMQLQRDLHAKLLAAKIQVVPTKPNS